MILHTIILVCCRQIRLNNIRIRHPFRNVKLFRNIGSSVTQCWWLPRAEDEQSVGDVDGCGTQSSDGCDREKGRHVGYCCSLA
ncbi:hypothetical protein T492DRAFT_230787 [Pavlovales sp. CCMP2436]|nr:hypothetical protein T492DRAFT_230787 [Pavlovales sp. CCMP2436]